MKYLLLVVFCLSVDCSFITTGLTTFAGSRLSYKIIGPIYEDKSRKEERISKLSKKYDIALKDNEEDVTNEANIVRPCDCKNLDCIRQFFAENSKCKPAYGPVTDPLYIYQSTVFFSHTNMTLTFTDAEVSGLSDSKIIEFYYNKKTKNVVLATEVSVLNKTCPIIYYTYRRPGRESIVLADVAGNVFKKVIFTAVMKMPLRLDQAEITAYTGDSGAYFDVGPKAFTSSDPQVQKAWASLLKSVPILYREELLYQAQLFLAFYIQSNICDFGDKLYSV